MTEEMKPCPICQRAVQMCYHGGAWRFICDKCHLQMEAGQDHDTAFTAWNTRSPALIAEAGGEEITEAMVEAGAKVYLAYDAGSDIEWAESVWPIFSTAEHYGDCIKVPMTCNRCLADEAKKLARNILIAALSAQVGK